jgi:hypothetical protein
VHSRVIFQITLGDPILETPLYSHYSSYISSHCTSQPSRFTSQIFPLHLPIFPFDLVELVPSLSLVYINSATSRTHEVGKREAAFYSQKIPRPIRSESEFHQWQTQINALQRAPLRLQQQLSLLDDNQNYFFYNFKVPHNTKRFSLFTYMQDR